MNPFPRRSTMRALAATLLLALLLSGCATPAPTGDNAAPAADTAAEAPAITLTVNGTEPTYLKVAITNNVDRDLTVTNQAFRLVDASGTVVPIYQVGMGSMRELVFPTYATLGPHETAKGVMSFFGVDSVAPYILHYDYDGASASAPVPEAPHAMSRSTQPEAGTTAGPSVTPTTPTPTSKPGIGDWINGTYLSARLVSSAPVPDAGDPTINRTNYTFTFIYHNATDVRLQIRFSIDEGTYFLPISDGRASMNFTYSSTHPLPVRIDLARVTSEDGGSSAPLDPLEITTFAWAP